MDKKYLKRRHNRYWVRVRIPKSVVNYFGKSELQQNLYTNDLAEANKLKHGVIAEFMGQFYKAEATLKGTQPETQREKLIELAKTKRKEIDSYSHEEIEQVKDLGILVDDLENMVSDVYGEKDSSTIVYFDPELADSEGVNLNAVEAAKDAYQIINPDSNPLSSLAEKYLSEKTQLKKSSFLRKEKNINHFIKWSGNPEITNVNKKTAGNYITKIIQERNLATNTVKNIKTDVGSLFTWAESRGYIENNPFRRIHIPINLKKTDDRIPWSNENIKICLDFKNITLNEFGATALALYTGMRLDEICNLKKTDIHENCIHIYKGKTKSSTRVIPVHYLLKDLLHLLNLKSKDGYIITDLCPGGYDDKRSANFQKKLKRLRDKLELPKGVVFHSLRNTFSTRMENLGIPSNHLSQLMGHEDGNMALDVYSGGLAIEPLRESISKLTYGTEVDSLAKNSIDKISANT